MTEENKDNKGKGRIWAYISKIKFNNGDELEIRKDDIVLFVGPNNAGKSQSLKDIYTKCDGDLPTIVIKEITTNKEGDSLLPLLDDVSKRTDNGSYLSYNINNRVINHDKNSGDTFFLQQPHYGVYREAFVAHLNTEARLGICNPAKTINRNAIKTNPIHYAAFDYKYARWLSESFHKAFGNNITPNIQHGLSIPLCIGQTIKLSKEYENEVERQAEYANILE